MVGRRASPSSSGGNGRGAVSLLMEVSRETGGNDGGDQSDTSHEDTPEVSDETSSCFEEAMKRCDALRRSPAYFESLLHSLPRKASSYTHVGPIGSKGNLMSKSVDLWSP